MICQPILKLYQIRAYNKEEHVICLVTAFDTDEAISVASTVLTTDYKIVSCHLWEDSKFCIIIREDNEVL